jgi:hypothetical protein
MNWSTQRRSQTPAAAPQASIALLPVFGLLCAIYPTAAALFLIGSIGFMMVAIADTTAWIFWWQQRRHPVCSGLVSEPHAISLPVLGNAAHASWVVVCVLRGDHSTNTWLCIAASLALVAVAAAIVLLAKPYAYALSPLELGLALVSGLLVSTWPVEALAR